MQGLETSPVVFTPSGKQLPDCPSLGDDSSFLVCPFKESKSENSTQNITIKFLKYLFLYIKSGRRTFNYHDITPLVVREYHQACDSNGKVKKERDKSMQGNA